MGIEAVIPAEESGNPIPAESDAESPVSSLPQPWIRRRIRPGPISLDVYLLPRPPADVKRETQLNLAPALGTIQKSLLTVTRDVLMAPTMRIAVGSHEISVPLS